VAHVQTKVNLFARTVKPYKMRVRMSLPPDMHDRWDAVNRLSRAALYS